MKEPPPQANVASQAARAAPSPQSPPCETPSGAPQAMVDALMKRKLAEMQADSQATSSGFTGGVYIGSGVVTVGGDIVGRDRVVHANNDTAIDELFQPLLDEVKQNVSADLQAEAEKRIVQLREQAKKFEPDLLVVNSALKWLKDNALMLVPRLQSIFQQVIIPRSMRQMAVIVLSANSDQAL
jgi:hypothetical protein